jgi:small subunit ribosomal protein S2
MGKELETKKAIKLDVGVKDLLEAGAHFGHQTHRWNPKMKRFIFEERHNIHIINLAITLQQLRDAVKVVTDTVSKHQSVMFVGTKKQAASVVKEIAEECGEFFIAKRWLGGTLTNLSTIRQSIKKLEQIERKIAQDAGEFTKKELVLMTKDQIKLNNNLEGIRSMRKVPGLIVVVDPSLEHIAVAEARRLKIPVIALLDTNCDPDPIDFPIVGNDDSVKSIRLILSTLCKAIIERKNMLKVMQPKEERLEEIFTRESV